MIVATALTVNFPAFAAGGPYTDFSSLIQYVEGVIKGFGDQYKINFG